jgi:hypothetical protein
MVIITSLACKTPCVDLSLTTPVMELWKVSKKKVFYLLLVKVPGVGEYKLPSEFGYYEAA